MAGIELVDLDVELELDIGEAPSSCSDRSSLKLSNVDLDSDLEGEEPVDLSGICLPSVTLHQAAQKGRADIVQQWLDALPPDKKIQVLTSKDDLWERTPLHVAALRGHLNVAELLIEHGVDPNLKDGEQKTPLHSACEGKGENCEQLVQLLLSKGAMVNAVDEDKYTPLHYAADNGRSKVVKLLLEAGAKANMKTDSNDTPINLAAENGHLLVVQELYNHSPGSITYEGAYRETPLHLACEHGHLDIAKFILESSPDVNVNVRDEGENTPLHYAATADENSEQLVVMLIDAGADINPKDSTDGTPLDSACDRGHVKAVSRLLEKGAEVGPLTLRNCIESGPYEDCALVILKTPQWANALRYSFNAGKGRETTPFREMIKKMPAAAEEVLNRCTMEEPETKEIDRYFSVAFNYEFIEDIQDKSSVDVHEANTGKKKKDEEVGGPSFHELWRQKYKGFTTKWGPVGFKKVDHPLAIMVQKGRLKLLKHPLVGSLLHYKWKTFGQYGYFLNMLLYIIFLIFLTTFALVTLNPQSQTCMDVFNGTSVFCSDSGSGSGALDMGIECGVCGLGEHERRFILSAAIIIIVISIIKLTLEVVQFIQLRLDYVLDWVNWMEVLIFVCSIIFVWVFHTGCLCPFNWQWQLGAVAVFLGWIDLIVFVQKFPLTGIYVLMFVNILYTFLRTVMLSFLLVIAFSLTFYMAFFEPGITRSPFSTPGRAIIKTMTMTTGEFDFDSIFRQAPNGESDAEQEIPFLPVSFTLWIIFVIIMPILLINMLVGLAVDDIKGIQEEAALKKLALQVDLVLTVEELLPRKIRRYFTVGCRTAYPNAKFTFWRAFQYAIWGGERYDTHENINAILKPPIDHSEEVHRKTDTLLSEVDEVKRTVAELTKRDQQEILLSKVDRMEERISELAERNKVLEELIREMSLKLGIGADM